MKIKIPFNAWSMERLALGTKRATSRTKKYGNIGDTFTADGMKFELDLIIKVPQWFVAEVLYRSEGAITTAEFIDVWTSIHKLKGYSPFDEVWYHHFKVI